VKALPDAGEPAAGPPSASIQRRVRLLTLLRAAADVGLDPLSVDTLHALAYLTDALAPVWHLPPLDPAVLKRASRPFFPVLQRDLDALVGQGLVEVVRFGYVSPDEGSSWRLSAEFRLVPHTAGPVLSVVDAFDEQVTKAVFVREVVYAASGLGRDGVDSIGILDAAYSDPLVDVGGVLDMGGREGLPNASAAAARGFAFAAGPDRHLSEPELIHLYVRHLYARMLGA
jgi:hypothetical protein